MDYELQANPDDESQAGIETDNSADSPTEQTTDHVTPSDEGEQTQTKKEEHDGNFATHPRWVERENDWKNRFNEQQQRHVDEIAKLREEINSRFNQTQEEIPQWFGGDDKSWAAFQEWNKAQIKQVEERTIASLQQKTTAEQKMIDEATEYFNEQVFSLESDRTLNPTGQKIDRNKLMKFVIDNEIVDTKGRWNWKAGFLAMRTHEAPKTTDRKKIANAIIDNSSVDTTKKAFASSDDFELPSGRPW